MATTDAFNMAVPAMVRICLYGDLQRFGKRFGLSIKTAAEGIHALAIQIPGFREKMREGWYQVRIAGEDVTEETLSARLHDPLLPGAVIHIVPRMEGAKRGGLFQVIAGVALIGASFIPGVNAIAWSVGASTMTLGSVAFSLGASLLLGGVAQMLTPQPKAPSMHSADNGKQNTYFSSLENMVAQGNPLPVLYGEMLVGSRRISQMLSTRDESSPDKVVNFGRMKGGLGVAGELFEGDLQHLKDDPKVPGIYKPRVIVR
ncbi:tail assembly protein [Salmonella enterica subsp. diarizonae serovar 48:i:z]|nr:tail assembly protein [Salmonella enterica subsp. diarizonae serovar 48:i:z]